VRINTSGFAQGVYTIMLATEQYGTVNKQMIVR
jgi:hypothetical protein